MRTKEPKKTMSSLRLDLGDDSKTGEFRTSLRELVAILFAVVFGVGLGKLAEAKTPLDYLLLATVYLAILQSWWGYNLGVIAGPSERNKLCYAVDVLLVVLYWFMIDRAFQLFWVLTLFLVKFALYIAWEGIRWADADKILASLIQIKRAFWINVLAFAFFAALFFMHFLFGNTIPQYTFIPLIIVALSLYRAKIGTIYSKCLRERQVTHSVSDELTRRLIEQARAASMNARIHLSHFPVGAAILAEGEIYIGCNVEFDNFSNTLHAEEVAIGNMIAAGRKAPNAMAVYTLQSELVFPCGMCLQSLYELGGSGMMIIACNDQQSDRKRISELLPHGFNLGLSDRSWP